MATSNTATGFTATAWTLYILGAILVYVVTWPLVEITWSKVEWTSQHGFTQATAHMRVHSRPPWVKWVYRPLRELSDLNGGNNPLVRYYWWWGNQLRS